MMTFKAILIAIVLSATALTVAEAGVLVTPDRHIVELSPGETKTVEYKVYNSGTDDLDMEIDPKDWSGTYVAKKVDINSWISLPQKKFIVKPAQARPFKVVISAPKNIDGELLAMLFLCYKEDKSSALNIRNGIPLYLVLKGTERYGAAIESIDAKYNKNPAYVEAEDNLNVIVKVRNTGNIHIIPKVEASVLDEKGDLIEKAVSTEEHIILRGQSYDYRFNWSALMLSPGRYKIQAAAVGAESTVEFEAKTPER